MGPANTDTDIMKPQPGTDSELLPSATKFNVLLRYQNIRNAMIGLIWPENVDNFKNIVRAQPQPQPNSIST